MMSCYTNISIGRVDHYMIIYNIECRITTFLGLALSIIRVAHFTHALCGNNKDITVKPIRIPGWVFEALGPKTTRGRRSHQGRK